MTEQPDPSQGEGPVIQRIVIRQMNERWDLGCERYGNLGLRIANGRRMSRDFREELQDALVYATGIEQQDDELIRILTHLLDIHVDWDGGCAVCNVTHPCHTVVDVDQMLGILGARNITRE